MKIGYILFNDVTIMDFIGIYDPISRIKSLGFLSNLSWDICGLEPTIKDNFGLSIVMGKINNNLSEYDMIVIPGGMGTRKLINNKDFIEWLQTAKDVKMKVSVCTGSFLLGAAGFLHDFIATTHFNEYDFLERYCKAVAKNPIVHDKNIITAGAVYSSIDLGLYLCDLILNDKNKLAEITKSMNYMDNNTINILKNNPEWQINY